MICGKWCAKGLLSTLNLSWDMDVAQLIPGMSALFICPSRECLTVLQVKCFLLSRNFKTSSDKQLIDQFDMITIKCAWKTSIYFPFADIP